MIITGYFKPTLGIRSLPALELPRDTPYAIVRLDQCTRSGRLLPNQLERYSVISGRLNELQSRGWLGDKSDFYRSIWKVRFASRQLSPKIAARRLIEEAKRRGISSEREMALISKTARAIATSDWTRCRKISAMDSFVSQLEDDDVVIWQTIISYGCDHFNDAGRHALERLPFRSVSHDDCFQARLASHWPESSHFGWRDVIGYADHGLLRYDFNVRLAQPQAEMLAYCSDLSLPKKIFGTHADMLAAFKADIGVNYLPKGK